MTEPRWHSRAQATGSAVDHALRTAAGIMPSREALAVDPGTAGTTFTWRDLERRTAHLAANLNELAAARAPGALVVEIVSDRSAAVLLRLVAAFRTALPVVLVDRAAADEERAAVRERLDRAGVSVLRWTPDDAGPLVSRAPARSTMRPGGDPVLPPHSLVLASGGSTGRPKLIVDAVSRRPASHPRLKVTSKLGWQADQTQLVIGRLHHAAPLMFFLRGLIDGNRIVIPTRYAPSIAVRLIEEQRVQWMQATPFQLERIAAWLKKKSGDLSGVRGVLHMSAPCPPSVKRFWIDLVGAEQVFEIYGATEGLGMTVATGSEWLARPGTVGRGFFTRVKVLDEALRPLPAGASGLVYLRSLGERAAPVYLGGGAALTSPDGFRSVGDHGTLDEDGYLYIEPRRTDLINVAGENVYPAEVEAVLVRCPGVVDAAVTAVPDDRLGTRPVALVTCWAATAPNERDVIAFCRGRLSGFKVPRQVYVVKRIPHTAAGKIDRRRVADMVATKIQDIEVDYRASYPVHSR
jgi:bile acid-coenzyme A ligase